MSLAAALPDLELHRGLQNTALHRRRADSGQPQRPWLQEQERALIYRCRVDKDRTLVCRATATDVFLWLVYGKLTPSYFSILTDSNLPSTGSHSIRSAHTKYPPLDPSALLTSPILHSATLSTTMPSANATPLYRRVVSSALNVIRPRPRGLEYTVLTTVACSFSWRCSGWTRPAPSNAALTASAKPWSRLVGSCGTA